MGQDAFETFLFTIRIIKHLVKINKREHSLSAPQCMSLYLREWVPNVKEFLSFFTNCFHSSFRNPRHIQAGLWLLIV